MVDEDMCPLKVQNWIVSDARDKTENTSKPDFPDFLGHPLSSKLLDATR